MQTDWKEIGRRQPVILIADDDAVCLEVGVKILQKLGFKVLEARNGQEAVEVFLSHQNEVNLVILDMTMPYNGGNAFTHLKKLSRHVKILIISGYANDRQIRELMDQGCNGFIQKPFSINALSRKIMDILND